MKKCMGLFLLIPALILASAFPVWATTDFSPQLYDGKIYRVALGSGTAPSAAEAALVGIKTGDMVENTDDGALYIMHATNVYTKITSAGAVTLTSMVVPLASNKVYIGNASGTANEKTLSGAITINTNGGVSLGSSVVSNAHLTTNAVNSGVIDDGTVSNIDLASDISAAKLSAGTVATAIDGNAVTNLDAANLLAGTVATAIDGNAITNLNSTNLTGTIANARLDADLQPLAEDDGGGLTNIVSGGIVSLDAAKLQAATVATAIDGSAITNLAGGNIASGTVPNARLDADLAKLADNDAGSLTNVIDGGIIGMSAAKLTAATVASAIDGSAVTNLDGANIASGDIASARLTANAPVATDFTAANDVLVGTGSGTFGVTAGSGALVVTNASTLSTNLSYYGAGGVLLSNVYNGP